MFSQTVAKTVVMDPTMLSDVPLPLRDKLGTACAAIRNSRMASRAAHAAIYDFCLAALKNGAGLEKFCSNNGITVRATQGGELPNPFLLPVKLATGVMETESGKSSWLVDNARVSKYASVFALARQDGISPNGFIGWIGEIGSLDKAVEIFKVRHAKQSGDEPNYEELEAIKAQFKSSVQKAVDRFKQQFLFGDQVISLENMKQLNIKPGKHTMYVDVGEDGSIIPIGLSSKSTGATENLLVASLPSPKGATAVELAEILDMMGAHKGTKCVAIVRNTDEGCSVKILELGNNTSIIIKGEFSHIPYFPKDAFLIDRNARVLLSKAYTGLKNSGLWHWEAGQQKLIVKPVYGNVETTLATLNHGKTQSGIFHVPTGATNSNVHIAVPLGSVPQEKEAEYRTNVSWTKPKTMSVDEVKSYIDNNTKSEQDLSSVKEFKVKIAKGVVSLLLKKFSKHSLENLQTRCAPAGVEFLAKTNNAIWTAQLAGMK